MRSDRTAHDAVRVGHDLPSNVRLIREEPDGTFTPEVSNLLDSIAVIAGRNQAERVPNRVVATSHVDANGALDCSHRGVFYEPCTWLADGEVAGDSAVVGILHVPPRLEVASHSHARAECEELLIEPRPRGFVVVQA